MNDRCAAGKITPLPKLAFLALVAAANISFPLLTSADVTAGVPQLISISTAPNPLVKGEAFRFTITGTGFDPNSAIVMFNGPGCPGLTCSFTSGSLTSGPTELSGIAMLGTGTFNVTVANGPRGTPSNSIALSVFDSSAGAPHLTTINTTPAPPLSGQAFTFTITGSGFDSNQSIVLFNGPGCTPCNFTVGSLTVNAAQLSGSAILGGGTFIVVVKNGPSGAASNSLLLTVSGAVIGTPQLTAINTSPDPPVNAQPFTFTITGTFDPNSAIVNFSGPGCTASLSCTIANGALASKDLAHLSGTVTLVGGSFTVTVQNGPNGTQSNTLRLQVSGSTPGTPQLRTMTTLPNPPMNAQAFTFTITGSDFDASSAIVSFDGPGCYLPSTTCIISNNALLARGTSELDGVAILTGGSFSVTVQNVLSGTTSNTLKLEVSGTPGAPQLKAITTSPSPPLSNQAFTFAIAGAGFDPTSAIVNFIGPGCTATLPCAIPNSALTSASPTQLSGTVVLSGGNFTVTVQNGPNGIVSSGLTLAVSGTTANPQLNAIMTSPDPPSGSQAFTFAITGTGFDPANAIVVFSGPGCNLATTCVIDNNALLNKSSSELDGVAILAGGTFNVTVLNGPVSGISNSLVLVVTSIAVPFQVSGISTSPNPPVDGQAFTFTVNGSGFNPANAAVQFNGPGCTPCIIANSSLSSATSTTLSGTVTLSAGNFTVIVQNGSGSFSNGVSITVSHASPGIQITGITTTPKVPVAGQAFTLSITGTGFDPNSILVRFTGPGCAPCTIANAALTSTALTAVSGTATLFTGSFTVTVQNGATEAVSNGLPLMVSNPAGTAPQITALSLSPSQPVDGQPFTFAISGSRFDPINAAVIFTGPNCAPCRIVNSALTTANSTQLTGTIALAAGNYTIGVQNGSSGALSNGQALTVAAPAGTTPQIQLIATSPVLPINAQAFTFTITGSGYDPASVVVSFTGPNCTPCTITGAALSTSTSTELDGTATLATGSYIVMVQNGNGPPSNTLQLIVYPAAGAAPHLDVSVTTPRSPRHGDQTIFILFGSGFDPNKVIVSFTGPSCTQATCVIPNSQIAVNFSITAIGGFAIFPAAGTFTVVAQNGPSGAPSNPLTITVQ